ncbi:transposase [Methylobacter svalbardensis]|uniref:transposase n=1 Tax=Methylobacter svalbardensis TaxID=3080016 RepID=UPI0030EBA003
MARLIRVAPVGVPQHIIQRGNNRQVCFVSEEDMAAYVGWLKKYSKENEVAIHAWVFMTNHVHLLCTPRSSGGISKMMQSLGRSYVRYFNFTYKRSGTLWEGRYKASLVQTEQYLLELYRYIELNPVRAKMVLEPEDYTWSSYQCNALGKQSELLTAHEVYLALGGNEEIRRSRYRDLFRAHVDSRLLEEIRHCVHRGLAIGHERFIEQIEALTGQRVSANKRGRPKGVKQ